MQDFDPEATHTVGTTQHGETLRDGGASITQIDRSPGAESQDDEEREAQSEPARGGISPHATHRR